MRIASLCFVALVSLLLQNPVSMAQEISNEFTKNYKAYNRAYARGNYQRAAELAAKAADLARQELGADHEKTAIMEINLAHALILIRKMEAAEPILLNAKKKIEKIHGPDHISLVTVYEDMAKIQAGREELDKSRVSLGKAIEIVSSAKGADDVEIARLLIQQGSVDIATQKMDMAQKKYEKALAILEANHGKDSIGTASTIALLGDLHLLKKEFDKAQEYYDRTLKIYEDNLVEDDPVLLSAHAKMAKIFIAMRDDRFIDHADRVIRFLDDEEGEARPLFIMQPLYPVFKDGKKPQGWVLLEFDVSASGKVEKARVMESLPPKLFDKVSLDVAKKWRFTPKVEDGQRVRQTNFRARLVFTRDNIEVHMGEMKL